MTRIKYTSDIMNYMSLFETITRARLKDCIVDGGRLIFVVEPTYIGRAIGRGGVNIRRLEHVLKRKIKIVEFNPQISRFLINLVHPLKIEDVREEEGCVTLVGRDTSTRGMLIGRNSRNIRHFEGITKRYFNVKCLKVI
ncbi:NusA-like transcription termination signal-binding factor [Candidatus Woesearchaeota archaeon CG08_land_8_20_14_0_20_47_9]|nr:MAG: hypothetical protein AUJ69_00940 [Candidatus Woesearchaeota archaeon CG1_02_47_18]PIO04408.1 MAG: NusA-like transcription termination signal-binding factor [Candidatus Woesearchaeota archaeon CG08_land_8_20_14_0_20_47_9]HII29655.1 NusA-like transcription termination signal-binding factor [Candidatus Woesearchaeota archaeon]